LRIFPPSDLPGTSPPIFHISLAGDPFLRTTSPNKACVGIQLPPCLSCTSFILTDNTFARLKRFYLHEKVEVAHSALYWLMKADKFSGIM
jgi:hypothetical protein